MNAVGEFRVTGGKDGLFLVVYGPKDLTEAKAGVPQAAFAVWQSDKAALDPAMFAAFLNASISASLGDFAPMNKICSPKEKTT